MKIRLMSMTGTREALFGIGLSHGLTSGVESLDDVSAGMWTRLETIASKLCRLGGGEDKFLRQIQCWWDAELPRYLWQEADQYRIGVTTQSESTMHTLHKRPFEPSMFEDGWIDPFILSRLNGELTSYRITPTPEGFLKLKNLLPEGFLQRRIWTLSLAQMKNIYRQRRRHRLPQWQVICRAFADATPAWLQGIYEPQTPAGEGDRK